MTPTLQLMLRLSLISAFLTTYFSASALTCKNGLFVTLDGNGEATATAEDFILNSNSCCSFGISYELSLDFGSTFQSTANYNCDDLGQSPVMIKYTDCLGVPSLCLTFIIIQENFGFCDNGCSNCCRPTVRSKPLTVSLSDDYTGELHAVWFDDGSYSNCAAGDLQYSFSSNPNDTIKTINCDNSGQNAINLWVTDAAGNQNFGELFFIVQINFGDCIGTGPCLPASVIRNGVVVPIGPEDLVCVTASQFDAASYVTNCSGASGYTLSFSENPNDTIVCYNCNDQGQQLVRIYIHDNLGNLNYGETFVIVEDFANHCTTNFNFLPPNDDVCNAFDINYLLNTDCNEKFFNIGASADANEVTPPLGACGDPNTWCDTANVAEKSVWFKFEVTDFGQATILTAGMNTQLALWNAASCEDIKAGTATLVAANDDSPDLPNGGSHLTADCLMPGKTYYLQMDGYNSAEGFFGLNFTATGPPCDVATLENKRVKNGFTFSPNPAAGFVKIQLQQPAARWLGGEALLSNIEGKAVLNQKITGETMALNLNNLPSGIYFLQLRAGKFSSDVQKLVILE